MAIKRLIQEIKNRHLLSKVSMVKDYVFAAVKILIGIFVQSYFLCLSGLYSVCVGLAKNSFFEGVKSLSGLDAGSPGYKENEYKHLARMSLFVLAGSIIYVVYMSRLFFVPSAFNYGMITAITIAAVSFTEFILAVIGIKKSKGILPWGLKCVNLTAAFMAIVLTQVAIMSFSGGAVLSVYNAIGGVVFGGLCIVTGAAMLLRYISYKKALR